MSPISLVIAIAACAAVAQASTLYTITDLGMLPGDTGSIGQAINAVGEVTGSSMQSNGVGHAYLWNGTAMQDLGTLGGSSSGGSGINDHAEVTGESKISGDMAYHAFLWNGTAMQDLGTLGGSNSGGIGINNRGEVAGFSNTFGGATHAF
jgi:probable HAF family extracellular repeat protein